MLKISNVKIILMKGTSKGTSKLCQIISWRKPTECKKHPHDKIWQDIGDEENLSDCIENFARLYEVSQNKYENISHILS